jgi:hypothetical protein
LIEWIAHISHRCDSASHMGSARSLMHATNSSTPTTRTRSVVAAAGGINVLTAAMRAHPAAEGVQQYCGTALGNLASSKEQRAAIAAAGDIDVLTAAMRRIQRTRRRARKCRSSAGLLWACWRCQRSIALRLDRKSRLRAATTGALVMFRTNWLGFMPLEPTGRWAAGNHSPLAPNKRTPTATKS